jgi:hypothetical protein
MDEGAAKRGEEEQERPRDVQEARYEDRDHGRVVGCQAQTAPRTDGKPRETAGGDAVDEGRDEGRNEGGE